MAYINQIQVGSTTYDIGMQNAIHFDGIALIDTWYSDLACSVKLTENKLAEGEFAYTNVAAINEKAVMIGCMWLPATGTAASMTATSYELICVEKDLGANKNISKWAVLGDVKKATGSAVIAATSTSISYGSSVTPTKGSALVSITPGTADLHTALSTAAIKSLGTVGTVAPTSAKVLTSVGNGTKIDVIKTVSIKGGLVSAGLASTETPISATVSDGGATATKGNVSITVPNAVAAVQTGDKAVTLSAASKSVVSTLTTQAQTVVTGAAASDKATISVSGNKLILPVSVLTALAGTKSVNVVSTFTSSSISVPTAAVLKGAVTGISNTDATATANIVTGVSYKNPTVTLTSAVVTASSYSNYDLDKTTASVVTNVSSSSGTVYGVPSTATSVVTSVAGSNVTAATGFTTATQKVVTGITSGSGEFVTNVTLGKTSQTVVTGVTTGTVVTSVL